MQSKNRIPFNVPHLTGKETHYIYDAVDSGKLSGNGKYTHLCHTFFQENYGFSKCLLTTSCTDALEMCALLIGVEPGDEIIIPSYTFTSTANAFILRGAKVVFADSCPGNPNINVEELEALITPKTKAIVPVHYAGVACDMDEIMALSAKYNLFVIEDAAQAIDSFYKDRPLGSIGHLATFSFHETKNLISGEGGMLVINDNALQQRAEIIWEKGTNRAAFWRGEVDKYGWVDIGSSFLPSEVVSAFLYAQLEELSNIQSQRKRIWTAYYNSLHILKNRGVRLPDIPSHASNNAHMFYLVCNSLEERNNLISYLNKNEVNAVFHYLSLHSSPYYLEKHDGRDLPCCDYYADCLVRLPFYYGLTREDINSVTTLIKEFYEL